MIDHAAFRRALLADPDARSPELDAHREACDECRQFAVRLAQFETRLGRALRIEVAAEPKRRPAPVRWYALAASLAMAVLVGGVLWLSAPRTSLASEVVAHMQDEPDAWNTVAPVSAEKADAVMDKAGVRLKPQGGTVSYASACHFRGRVVPHLVVQSGAGPVTVMVLTHEKVAHEEHFEEGGYRGRLLPVAGHGSIAVLEQAARTPDLNVDAVAAQVRAALVYTP